jgi:hypothetical protein
MKRETGKHFLDRLAEFPAYLFVFSIMLVARFIVLVFTRECKGASSLSPAMAKVKMPLRTVDVNFAPAFSSTQSVRKKVDIEDEFKFIPKMQGVKSGMYFHLYLAKGLITRKTHDGVRMFVPYTRADAKANQLDFSINGAIHFTKMEMRGKAIKGVESAQVEANFPDSCFDMPIMEDEPSVPSEPFMVPEHTPIQDPAVTASESRAIVSKSGDFFTVGPIVQMGPVKKTDKDGKAYEIFCVTVQTKNGFKKDFYGEMLGEVTAKLGAEIGDRVKIRRSGRESFTVVVNGREEPRTRNVFDFSIIN